MFSNARMGAAQQVPPPTSIHDVCGSAAPLSGYDPASSFGASRSLIGTIDRGPAKRTMSRPSHFLETVYLWCGEGDRNRTLRRKVYQSSTSAAIRATEGIGADIALAAVGPCLLDHIWCCYVTTLQIGKCP